MKRFYEWKKTLFDYTSGNQFNSRTNKKHRKDNNSNLNRPIS